MEYSSPLAAMRPQPCPAWGNRRDLPMPRSRFGGCSTYGPNSFDFRNMSMQQAKPEKKDYFTLRPVRGSSPTSSLTADLDANFHIDQSPQLTTPRRSLFSANVFKPTDEMDLITPPIQREGATTPPVPSSSPGMDIMDVSPLPHKAPYFMAQVTLASPSPDETPEESLFADMLSPDDCPTPLALPVQAPTYLHVPERRRPVTRPSLTRNKGYFSTSSITQRPSSADNPLPPFQFGNVASAGLTCSSTPSLIESTTVSPIAEVETFGSMLPPPRRTSIGAASRNNGSPCSGHIRKSSTGRPPLSRPPRKQIRRSLSMFQHPDEIMKEEQECYEQPAPALSSMMEVEQEPTLTLPHFIPEGEADGLPRITQDTMADVLDQKYNSKYEKIVVIDCRFEYEYNGGHIENAMNFNDKQLLTEKLFAQDASPASTLLIFHCEYSVHRAPLTAKYVRSHDRNANMINYPRLSYPEMYILDGGYSKFYSQYRNKCYPQNYVEMNDTRHEQACEIGMAKVKQRQKLFRAQTFAFGQNGHDEMEDSPTAQGKGVGGRILASRSTSAFNVGLDLSEGIAQSYARRMASY